MPGASGDACLPSTALPVLAGEAGGALHGERGLASAKRLHSHSLAFLSASTGTPGGADGTRVAPSLSGSGLVYSFHTNKKKKRKLRSKKNALEAFYPKYLHYQNVARLTLAPLPRRLQCDCQHNTCGGSCDRCCPGFNQFPWKPATADSANECQRKLEPGFSFLFPAVRRAQVGRASPAPRRCSAAKSFTKIVWFVVCSTGCSVDQQCC